MKDETRDKWELKSNEVTIYEEIGHGAFGKVCKGIMCMKTGQSVSHTTKTIANSTITVAVKMLQGMSRWFSRAHSDNPRLPLRLRNLIPEVNSENLSNVFGPH